MAVPEKLTSQFSIESILRKEEKLLEKRSVSSYSDLLVHNEEGAAYDLWKKNFCKRDCCPEPLRRGLEEVPPFLESRHRLTEHWVYENHIRPLPTLHPHPILSSKQRECDLVPSPSSTWSPPPHHQKAVVEKRRHHPLDYWMVDRMTSRRDGTHPYLSNFQRRAYSDGFPRFREFWSNPRDERDVFPALHGRHNGRLVDDGDSDEGNRKGGQVRFTHTQSTELERVFTLQKYVSPQERKSLARSIDLSERQVKTWFQNRRAKWRRIKLEDEMRSRMNKDSVSFELNEKERHVINTDEKLKTEEKCQQNSFRMQYCLHEGDRLC